MGIKDQLNPEEEDETREIASVCIHVERAVESVKNFNILKQIIPNSMAEDVDKIWKVCCLLANFKGPLVVWSRPLEIRQYRVSQKFVPLISCTITFDQMFIFK